MKVQLVCKSLWPRGEGREDLGLDRYKSPLTSTITTLGVLAWLQDRILQASVTLFPVNGAG